jgi:hypothetical protein
MTTGGVTAARIADRAAGVSRPRWPGQAEGVVRHATRQVAAAVRHRFTGSPADTWALVALRRAREEAR